MYKSLKINNGEMFNVYDVVEIDSEIYIVLNDKKFTYPFNKNETIFRTTKPIKKIGTLNEYPEYF